MTAQSAGVGLYGKIPDRGDFLRAGVGGSLTRGLADWLQEANDRLVRGGSTWPFCATFFLYRDANPDAVAIGVLIPSRDRAGRSFPLAIYAALPAAQALPDWSIAPRLYAPFLGAATELALESATLGADALAAQTLALPLPGERDRGLALGERERDLSGAPAAQLWADLRTPGAGYYAVNTLVTASRNAMAGGGESGKARLALTCPIARPTDLEFWLLALERALRLRRAPPAFLWGQSELLVSFGAPFPSLPGAGDDATTMHSRTWSLVTAQTDAIHRARDALPPATRRAIESEASSLWSIAQTITTPAK